MGSGNSDTRKGGTPRRKVLFAECSDDLHADVHVVSDALGITAAALIRRAVRRELYEIRKEPIAA